MKKLFLLLGIFLFFCLVGISQNSLAQVYNVYHCRSIDSAGYWILQTNVSTSGDTCFAIGSSDVILDLNGYSIIHNTTDSLTTILIDITAKNVTIKNGYIYAGSQTGGSVIKTTAFTNNLVIENLKIQKIAGKYLTYGIFLDAISLNYTQWFDGNIIIKNVDLHLAFADENLRIAGSPAWKPFAYWENIRLENLDLRYSNNYDIDINEDVKDLTSCGLQFNESKVLNYGYNVSLSKDPCPAGPTIIRIMVKDTLLGNTGQTTSDTCFLFTNATVCVDGNCLTSNNTNWYNIYGELYHCYVPEKGIDKMTNLPVYEFNLTEGTYTVNASYPNYKTENYTKYFYGVEYYVFFLSTPDTAGISVYVKNANTYEPINGAKINVFYANGTPASYPQRGTMYEYTDEYGFVRITGLKKNLEYYFTLSAFGYSPYTSSTFNLTEDTNFTAYMSPTTEAIYLSAYPVTYIYPSTVINWTVNATSGVSPTLIEIYCQNSTDRLLIISFYSPYYPYSIGANIGVLGNFNCYAYAPNYNLTSNYVYVSVSEEIPSLPPEQPGIYEPYINRSLLDQLGVGYIAPLFTPILLILVTILGISAYITKSIGFEKPSLVFAISFISLLIVITVLGLFPIWLLIILIVITAFLLAKFVLGLI